MLTTLFGRSLTASTTDTVTLMVMFELADGSWADITADFMSGSIRRGRNRELDRYQAGSATLVLRNEDRTYDPNYTGSPYNGSILPMRRMQVLAMQNSVVYKVFTGYIDEWRQVYDGPNSATAEVRLTDAFKALQVNTVGDDTSAYASQVRADSPTYWWRVNEPSGSTTITDQTAGLALTSFGSPTMGATSLVTQDSDTAYSSANQTSGFWQRANDLLPTGTQGSITLELVIKTSVAQASDSFLFTVSNTMTNTAGNVPEFMFQVPSGDNKIYFTYTSSAVTYNLASNSAINDGVAHHVCGVYNAVTGIGSLYVDGALVTSTPFTTIASVQNPQEITVGDRDSVNDVLRLNAFQGSLDEPAIYSAALTAAQVAAHYAAFRAWDDDTPGGRIGRVLDLIDWPTSDRVVSTGTSTLQAVAVANQTALDVAQLAADSDFGQIYIDAQGAVVFEGRADGVNQTSQGTFADSRNTGEDVRMIDPEYTDQLIRNRATIQRTDGIAKTSSDATSIAAYLTHSYSKTGLNHDSDATSLAAAQYIVGKYKDPLQRISRLVLEPRKDPNNLFPHALGRELTDRVTVKYTPQGVGTVFSQDAIIEGIEHEFGPKMWRTTWSLSPADTLAYWQLGTAGFSELGTTTRLFF